MMQEIGIFSASDDPEGSFVPPEFDNTGSTFEVRVAKPCQGFKSAFSFFQRITHGTLMFAAESFGSYSSTH